MWWITACESRTWPSRLLCLAGSVGFATQAQRSRKEEGKRSDGHQIWCFRSTAETKCQEGALFGSKTDLVSLCLCLTSSIHTHTHTHTQKKTKKKEKKEKLQVDKKKRKKQEKEILLLAGLSQFSSHLWAVTPWLRSPIVTAMNLLLLSADYTPVTKLDEWHAWQYM